MKKALVIVMLVGMLLSILPGCETTPVSKFDQIMNGLEESDMDCPAYDLEKYTANYWESDVIYNEAVMPLEEEDGSMAPIPLLYKAEKILAVRDSFLGTLYEEGKDYTLENGKLVIPEGSSIQTIEHDQYFPTRKTKGKKLKSADGKSYVLWCDGFNLHQWQIAVTYVHTDEWEGTVPPAQGESLPNTLFKLEKKEPVKILVYGDSIATGANSSSETGDEPFAPKWFEMMEASLKKKYGYDDITIINTAVGGTDSAWGADNAYENGKKYEPDLAIIAFGMNDVGTDPYVFTSNISRIVNTISQGNEDCEFILVATMLANPETTFSGNQAQFREALKNTQWGDDSHIVIADMTTYYEDLLAKKRYWDMSCNNINHPNDFLARGYAQLMLRTLEK